jgi:hypothetical protein
MFDFLNSEDKLLLTQFPRFARAPEFISTPLLRFTPRRILPLWGLTNGINAVMIECVHGGKHTCPQTRGLSFRLAYRWDGGLHRVYA